MDKEKEGFVRDEKGRFSEGGAGGPGRPKFSLVTILKDELQKCPPGENKKTYAQKLIDKMINKAVEDGDDAQIKNILQYVDGMPKQHITHDGKLTLEEFLSDSDETRTDQE